MALISSDDANIDAVNFVEQASHKSAPGTGHRILYALSDGFYERDASGTYKRLASGDNLADIADLTPSDGLFIVGDGSDFVGESGDTARTSLGLGTGDSPEFTGLKLSGLTASRLLAASAANVIESVAALTAWIAGTANQINVADDGDGSVTLSTPQDIHSGASPQFAGLNLSGLTADKLIKADASKNLVSVDDGAGVHAKVAGWWYQDNVAAGQSGVALNLGGDANRTELPVARAGSVVGIAVYSNEARTGGTLTVEVTIDGVGTGLTAVLDATNTQTHYNTQAAGLDTFTAGQRIGVKITTDAGWAPTTADITVEVEIAFD